MSQPGDEGGGDGPLVLEEIRKLISQLLRQFHEGHDAQGPAQQRAFPFQTADGPGDRLKRLFRLRRGLALGRLVEAVVKTAFAQHRGLGRHGRRVAGAAGFQRLQQVRGTGKLFFLDPVVEAFRRVPESAHHDAEFFRDVGGPGEPEIVAAHDRHEKFHNPFAQDTARQKAGPGRVEENIATGFLKQFTQMRFLPRLLEEVVQKRRDGLVRGEDGLEIGRKVQFQRRKPDDEVQEAVDGAHVQGAVAPQDGVHPATRLLARPARRAAIKAERGVLEPPDDPFLHLRRRAVGEGDGQNFGPAAGSALPGAASGEGIVRALRRAGQMRQKARRQLIGLAGARRSPDLPQLGQERRHGDAYALSSSGNMPASPPCPVDSRTARHRLERMLSLRRFLVTCSSGIWT